MLSMFETTKQGTIAMKKLTSAVLGGVTMLALASQAGATPLFDAITGQTSIGSGPINATFYFASFASDSANFSRLNDVKLVLSGDPADGGSVALGLYADAGGFPGSLIASIGSVADSLPGPSLAAIDHPVVPNIALSAGTRYWIGYDASTAATQLSFEAADAGIGVPGQYYTVGPLPAGRLGNDTGAVQLLLNAAIPEPVSMAVLGTGLRGLFGARRRGH